ncbi:hypothetical protein THOM_3236, partial [Trachipleistophora hominis]
VSFNCDIDGWIECYVRSCLFGLVIHSIMKEENLHVLNTTLQISNDQ